MEPEYSFDKVKFAALAVVRNTDARPSSTVDIDILSYFKEAPLEETESQSRYL